MLNFAVWDAWWNAIVLGITGFSRVLVVETMCRRDHEDALRISVRSSRMPSWSSAVRSDADPDVDSVSATATATDTDTATDPAPARSPGLLSRLRLDGGGGSASSARHGHFEERGCGDRAERTPSACLQASANLSAAGLGDCHLGHFSPRRGRPQRLGKRNVEGGTSAGGAPFVEMKRDDERCS